MVDSSDKRDFRRMRVDIKAVFKVNDQDELFEGMVTDLSATGLQLVTEHRMVTGDKLEIKVKPDKTVVPPLYAMLKILRIDVVEEGARYHVGCEITEMLA